jgi:tRNA A-37 threonylcarbamoyl transferase component Bud32
MVGTLHDNTTGFRAALIGAETLEILDHDESILEDRRMLNAGVLTRDALYIRDTAGVLACGLAAGLEFDPHPARMQGADDSHHGVIFGELQSENSSVNVAVKPFKTDVRAAAVREFVAYEFMQKMGFESFIPLGVVAGRRAVYLVTIEEPSLKTFNNMRWSPAAFRDSSLGDEQAELLGQAGDYLGAMHAAGITHGDAEPKNAALSERGKVGFIDLESMQYDPKGMGGEAMTRRIIDDLANFFGVLTRRFEYGDGGSPEQRLEQFDEQFLLRYQKAYREFAMFGTSAKTKVLFSEIRDSLMRLVS